MNSISGIFDKDNFRFYVLIIENPNNTFRDRLVWLKTEVATGILLDMHISEDTFFMGFTETELIGDEMVTYLGKQYIQRMAVNINTFDAPTVEKTQVYATTIIEMDKGDKYGRLLIIEGKEYFVRVEKANNYHISIIRRDSPNDFTLIQPTPGYLFQNLRGTTVFVNDDNQIVFTDGERFNVLDLEGVVVQSFDLELGLTLSADRNFVFYKDKRYYIFYSTKTKLTNTLLILDENFTPLIQKEFDEILMLRVVHRGEKKYVTGMLDSTVKNIREPLANIAGNMGFLECFEDEPILWSDEYFRSFQFEECDLNMHIGLGSRAFTNYVATPGVGYKDEHYLAREILDNYLAVNTNQTTFGNTNFLLYPFTSEIPGPCTDYSAYDEVEEARHNRSYFVTRKMITEHLDSVQNGSSNYVPPWAIRKWPGNGNTAIGQPHQLAPFVDQNENGIYEPLLGDYPVIYGDECIFSITHYWDQNDENINLEFHSYIYHFNCDTNDVFRNVLMRKLRIISKGADLDEFYLGVYQEGDLGNPMNDYIGTHVDLGMTYFYNGTLFDPPYYNLGGFSSQLAAMGTLILQGFKQEDDGMDNAVGVEEGESVNGLGYGDGIVDNEYRGLEYSVPYYDVNTTFTNIDGLTPAIWGSPMNYVGWKNNFKGLTGAGSPSTYGGLGYGGTVSSRYTFPWNQDSLHFSTNGNPPPFEGWSEMNNDGANTLNEVGDRKILASFGETRLRPGDSITIDYAVIFVRDSITSTSITSSVESLFQLGEEVKTAFTTNEATCGKNFEGVFVEMPDRDNVPLDTLKIYPNPTLGQVKITGLTTENTINIYAINGALVKQITNHLSEHIIDISSLSGGIYFFHIVDDSHNVVKKVVKL